MFIDPERSSLSPQRGEMFIEPMRSILSPQRGDMSEFAFDTLWEIEQILWFKRYIKLSE